MTIIPVHTPPTHNVLFYNNRRQGLAIFMTQINRERFASRREAELAAEQALLKECMPHCSVVIAHHENGAPYLVYADGRAHGNAPLPAISLSHSRYKAAIALMSPGTRLGIDIETADRNEQIARVAQKFLSPQQIKQGWNRNEATLLISWTTKEALYKAAGIDGWALHDIPLPHPQSTRLIDSVKLADGRRFNITTEFSIEPEDEPMSTITVAWSR